MEIFCHIAVLSWSCFVAELFCSGTFLLCVEQCKLHKLSQSHGLRNLSQSHGLRNLSQSHGLRLDAPQQAKT